MKKSTIRDPAASYVVSNGQPVPIRGGLIPEEKLLNAISKGATAQEAGVHTVSATQASRSLSDILSKVHYQGESFQIKRGREIIAKIVPVDSQQRAPKVSELNDFFSRLPALSADDCQDFADTIKELRANFDNEKQQWD